MLDTHASDLMPSPLFYINVSQSKWDLAISAVLECTDTHSREITDMEVFAFLLKGGYSRGKSAVMRANSYI